jgi:hypothetical protein
VTFDNAVAAMNDSLKKSGQYDNNMHLNAETESALKAAKNLRSDEKPRQLRRLYHRTRRTVHAGLPRPR